MEIKTAYDPKPIGTRCADWCAWVDGNEELGQGTGSTEAEAIASLQDQIAELL